MLDGVLWVLCSGVAWLAKGIGFQIVSDCYGLFSAVPHQYLSQLGVTLTGASKIPDSIPPKAITS